MSTTTFHTFSQLAEAYRPRPVQLRRVAPGSFTFRVKSLSRGEFLQREDIETHCQQHGLTIKRWTTTKSGLEAIVSSR